jgi:hypothetical protein
MRSQPRQFAVGSPPPSVPTPEGRTHCKIAIIWNHAALEPIAGNVWPTAPQFCGVKFFETGALTVPIATLGSDVRVTSIAADRLGHGAQWVNA